MDDNEDNEFNTKNLVYFRKSIFSLVEYFYNIFFSIFNKYCKDISIQLIADNKREYEQFINFIEKSLMNEVEVQRKSIEYINNNIKNNNLIRDSIIGDIEKLCDKYRQNIDFRMLNLSSIFYENFYSQLLEYCGLKASNYNKINFKDSTSDNLVNKLVSSLKHSNMDKESMFKNSKNKLDKLAKNRDKKIANGKELDREKNIEKVGNKKGFLKNIEDYNDKLKNRINIKEQIDLKVKEPKIKELKINNPESIILKDPQVVNKIISEKSKDEKNRIENLGKNNEMVNNPSKTMANKMSFDIFGQMFGLGMRNLFKNNNLNIGNNIGQMIGNIGNKINNLVNGHKTRGNKYNSKKKNFKNIKNMVQNKQGELHYHKNNTKYKSGNREEIIRNREKLNKIRNANTEFTKIQVIKIDNSRGF